MEIRLIESESQFDEYRREIGKMFARLNELDNSQLSQLKTLAKLVEIYEKEKFPITLPSPIDAIRFRMEQAGLVDADLVKYIGSRSKVSEVLAGKRGLSISMIRSLNKGLGIPVEVLVGDDDNQSTDEAEIRSLNPSVMKKVRSADWKLPLPNFSHLGVVKEAFPSCTLFRKSQKVSELRGKFDSHLLAYWVFSLAETELKEIDFSQLGTFNPELISEDFLRTVARLSSKDNGIALARDYLSRHGIIVATQKTIPELTFDACALIHKSGHPVIAFTLRYDRIDNFWFNLLHELAHISKHFEIIGGGLFEDLEVASKDPIEREADKAALEAAIPFDEWRRSEAYLKRNVKAVKATAEKFKIHPALVAGRLRHDLNDFTLFSDLLGHGSITPIFRKLRKATK